LRAAYIEQTGPADVIRYGQLPDPAPGPTDVLVEVRYTTVNPVDALIRSGRYPVPTPFPFVVGRDLIGRVVSASSGAAGFAAGDLVWCNSLGHGGRQGAAAELAVVAADRLYRLPGGVNPADAVTLLHPAATAYLGVITHGGLRTGETVLVTGGAGNVGSAAIAIAVNAGARVVATASAADAAYCRELGAWQVLDYHDPALTQRVRELCPEGIDVYFDCAAVNDLSAGVAVLAERGRMVILSGIQQPVLPVTTLFQKTGSIRGFVISTATVSELAAAAGEVNRLMTRGRLRTRRSVNRNLSELADVHRQLESGELRGTRVVVDVNVSNVSNVSLSA
jgi:2-desacetyl-2-hydroxyethyl bacteriochlorophyllide A dehydrogenase